MTSTDPPAGNVLEPGVDADDEHRGHNGRERPSSPPPEADEPLTPIPGGPEEGPDPRRHPES